MGRGPSAGADHGAAVAHRGGGPGRSAAAPRERDAASDVSRRLPGRSSTTRSGCPRARRRSGVRRQDAGQPSVGRRTLGARQAAGGRGRRHGGGAGLQIAPWPAGPPGGHSRWGRSHAPARHPDRRAGAHAHRLRLDGRRRGGRTRNRRSLCPRTRLAAGAHCRHRARPAARRRGPGSGDPRSGRRTTPHPLRRGASDAQADPGREIAGPAHQPPRGGVQRGLLLAGRAADRRGRWLPVPLEPLGGRARALDRRSWVHG